MSGLELEHATKADAVSSHPTTKLPIETEKTPTPSEVMESERATVTHDASGRSSNARDPEKATTAPTAPQSPRNLKPISWISLLLSLLSAILLFSLDNTIVADVQPRIIDTLGEISKLPWISVAFALGAIATNLPWAKLYGQFENKTLFIASMVIFEAGSALCGAAPTMNALIVGRTLCGIGGMGTYLGTINMVSVLTTEAERPVYLSFVGLTWGIGTVLGPIIGGAFADSSATWRWSFYINLCIGAVAAPAYFFLLPTFDPRPGLGFVSKARKLDFVGAVLVAGAFTSLIMAISFGGGVYAWNSGQIIALFVVTGVLWIAFVVQQARALFTSEENRLFPVDFIKSWEMDILFAQTAAAQVCVFVPIYFIPLYFQFVRSESALGAGVRLLPFVALLVFAVVVNGVMMGKLGLYMPWYLVGGLLVIVGASLLHTITADFAPSRVYGYTVIAAIGTGMFSQAGFPIAQVKVLPDMIPLATAFIGFAQIGGVALALTISNSIFLNQATNRISSILPQVPRAAVQQVISNAGGSLLESLSSIDRANVLDAVVQSIDDVFITVIVAGTVVTLLSLFMKRERLFVQSKDGESISKEETEAMRKGSGPSSF